MKEKTGKLAAAFPLAHGFAARANFIGQFFLCPAMSYAFLVEFLVPCLMLLPAPRAGEDEHLHPLEEVTERTYQESLFLTIAHEVARFPVKQRRALLIDLANCMLFDASPTPLQKAFLREGIQLKAYQELLPKDPLKCSRHAALLTYAYQRVARLPGVRAYLLAG